MIIVPKGYVALVLKSSRFSNGVYEMGFYPNDSNFSFEKDWAKAKGLHQLTVGQVVFMKGPENNLANPQHWYSHEVTDVKIPN